LHIAIKKRHLGVKTATNSKEKKFKLVFPALPNSPKYDLDKELKIGKSEGDIVLNNDSLSPVHATVTHRDGMIFILDHKSASGTTVNGQKIPSGKNIILDEKDQIQLGSVQMRVMVVEHEIDPEEVPPPSPVEVRVDKTFKIDLAALQQNQPKSTQKEAPEVKKIITKKKKFKFKFPSFSSDDDRGANALIRFIGLVIDACIAMGIANILDGNEELGKMINDIEMLVREQVDIVYGGFLEPSLQSVSFVSDAIKELFAFLNQEFSFVRVLVLTGVLRFAFTLFVGVTLGQLLVGIRSSGHFIWKRVGGVLREIVGIVTGPLLLFDLPALISKKTFKEVLTQTKITCPSTVRSVFYIVLFLPLGAGFFIVSPLMRGGEIEEPILTQFKEYQVETSAVENKISVVI
jgi:hypothetical protein